MTSIVRRLLVAAAVPVLLLIAGCGTTEAGSAAMVGDRRIDVAQVQDAYRDLTVLLGQDAQATQADILRFLILEPYVTAAAEKHGIGVSTWRAEKEFSAEPDRTVAEPSTSGVAVVRSLIAFTNLQNGALSTEQVDEVFTGIIDDLRADGVRVNPRYGSSFDYDGLQIRSEAANWLKITATPTPPATPGTDPQQGTDPQTQPDVTETPTP